MPCSTGCARPGRFTFREVGRVRAKGKQQPITVHEVLDARGAEMDARWSRLGRRSSRASPPGTRASSRSRGRGFGDAVRIAPGDHARGGYLRRTTTCAGSTPPAGWDGVDNRLDK